MVRPTYGSCMGPHCKYWAPRCAGNYCQACCTRLHDGTLWHGHYRPSGQRYLAPDSPVLVEESNLPSHYGGQDNKATAADTEPQEPVIGNIEEVENNEKEVLLPLSDNSYFPPRGKSSEFPIKYVK